MPPSTVATARGADDLAVQVAPIVDMDDEQIGGDTLDGHALQLIIIDHLVVVEMMAMVGARLGGLCFLDGADSRYRRKST